MQRNVFIEFALGSETRQPKDVLACAGPESPQFGPLNPLVHFPTLAL